MQSLLQATINGVLMGSIYGLIAVGLTLVFGVIKVINFAHGSFLMVGMFATYWAVALLGVDPYWGLLLIVPLSFAFGYVVNQTLINPVFKMEKGVREPFGVLLVTSGVWLILDNLALLLFGADFRTVKVSYWSDAFNIGPVMLSAPRLYAFVATIVGACLLYLFLKKTTTGQAIRATGQDRDVAGLMGVNVYRIFNIAFGVGTAMTCAVGALLTPFFYVHPSVGHPFSIKAFVIVILGGLGSIPGALIGGLIVGIVESTAAQFIEATWTAVIIYVIFLAVLFFKPEGILGLKGDW